MNVIAKANAYMCAGEGERECCFLYLTKQQCMKI